MKRTALILGAAALLSLAGPAQAWHTQPTPTPTATWDCDEEDEEQCPTPTPTSTPSPTPTSTPSSTATPDPTATPSPSPTPTPSSLPVGFASVDCEPGTDQPRLTWGASNPTDAPIEVRLLFDGVDTMVVPPMVVGPGHTASRFNAYEGTHVVSLTTGFEDAADGPIVLFEGTLTAPACEPTPPPTHPNVTPPPTAAESPSRLASSNDALAIIAIWAFLIGLALIAYVVMDEYVERNIRRNRERLERNDPDA